MRTIFRSFAGFLLVVMLVTFTMWRNDTLAAIPTVNALLKDAEGQIGELSGLINGGVTENGGDASDPDASQPTGDPYKAFDPVTGVSAELDAALVAAITAHQNEVDLSAFSTTAEDLKSAMTQFFFSHPELFYVSTTYSITSKQGSSVATKLNLQYLYGPAQVPQMKLEYEAALQQIVSGIPADASDFDKALYLHDYFVQNYAYDYEGFAKEQQQPGSSHAIRDTHAFFTQKIGVCQAYMLAMVATAREVGLECIPVVSKEMNHTWNLIKLDGEWYHLDVTWDDAGGEQAAVYPSYVSYEYFLLSGEALYTSGRTQPWEAMQQADSKTYDAALWHDAATPMVKYGDTYYCMLYIQNKLGSSGYSAICGGTPTELTVIRDLNSMYWHPANSTSQKYVRCFASVVVYENLLIFNSNDAFYGFDPASKSLRPLYSFAGTLGNDQIFGISNLSGNVITYVRAADATGAFTEENWEIQLSIP